MPRITEESLAIHCEVRLIEPSTEGKSAKIEWRCRECAELIDDDGLPLTHECAT